jgi:hypothetical protein
LLNQFYHFAVVYTGYTMELYSDGEMDTFVLHNGDVASTQKAITFGRKDVGIGNYFLHGSLDEVRIYDKALPPDEIATFKIVVDYYYGRREGT